MPGARRARCKPVSEGVVRLIVLQVVDFLFDVALVVVTDQVLDFEDDLPQLLGKVHFVLLVHDGFPG